MDELKQAQERAEALNKGIENLKSAVANSATKEELATAVDKAIKDLNIEKMSNEITEMKELAQELGLQVGQLIASGDAAKAETIEGVVKANFKSIQEVVKSENREAFHSFAVSYKATATTAAVTSTRTYRDNELVPLTARRMVMEDLFRHIPIGADNAGQVAYIDWDEATTARAAAAVAEGAAFPESTVAWEEKTIKLKKIGDTIPVTEEFMFDEARFAGELAEFLAENVDLAVDDQLLSGDGTGANLTGLLTTAPAYTPVGRSITDASLYDLVPILRETIVKGKGSKFQPNFMMMNLTEINKYKLKKDANNNYIMPPFVSQSGNVIDGVPVIENNNMADNTLVIGDSRRGRIYDSTEGYSLSVGYVNAQFASDLKTMKGRRRLALLIKDSEKLGYLQVSSISAALTALAGV